MNGNLAIWLKPVAIACSVVLSLAFAVGYWSEDLVERTVLGHAESSANTWRREFTGSVPDLTALIRDGQPTNAQKSFVEATLAGSDIFRFELFDRNGVLTFISDQALFAVEETELFNQTALDTVQTGEMDIAVEDGRTTEYRPDWYVEAYMPISLPGEGVIGVVEVYVDVSGLATALRSKFNWLALFLLGATAVLYVFPSVLLIARHKQLRQRDKELLRISNVDRLTGVMNRSTFSQVVADRFKARDKQGGNIGILYVDLDKFKHINDSFGHDAGDQILSHIAQLMTSVCRKGDIVARLGGDEFVMLCDIDSAADLLSIGNRLLKSTLVPYCTGSLEILPEISIGLHLSCAGESVRQALHRADLAVYKAKRAGRCRAVLFSEDLEIREQRSRVVADHIREGMGKELFFLEFQPIFSSDKRLAGFEALLRLKTVDGEVIPPDEFIPIAEEIGVIADMGLWTIRKGVEAACAWPAHKFVAINVSAYEFRSGELPSYVEKVLQEQGVSADRLCLELVETTLLSDDDSVKEQLVDLKALGVQLAIDDFGTGYSSLGYLWRYSFDRLKIDKSFLEGFDYDQKRYRRIVETIVMLGHQLGMTVTAEGVENAAQLKGMRAAGCDFLQGFLLSRPVSLTKATHLAVQDDAAAKFGR